jgi:hypothetical protein
MLKEQRDDWSVTPHAVATDANSEQWRDKVVLTCHEDGWMDGWMDGWKFGTGKWNMRL